MKDRQFMIMLGLVVAAGLVMGLIAFRMTGGSAAVATAAVGTKQIGGDPNAPRPSAADAMVDAPSDAASQTVDAGAQSGEPTPTTTDAPEMRGPANGDPPGTVTEPSSPPAVPTEAAGESSQ